MKKIVLIAALLLALCSCTSGEQPSDSAKPVISPNVTQQAIKEYKTIGKEENNEKYENFNEYQDCAYDFDHDDVEENITLYTSAQKDDNGEFMWDDSQNWILAVEGNNGSYTLYEAHERGKLELFVSENYGENGEEYPSIRLMISTSSGFEIREYTYRDGNFREEVVYNAGSLNELSVNQY